MLFTVLFELSLFVHYCNGNASGAKGHQINQKEQQAHFKLSLNSLLWEVPFAGQATRVFLHILK